MGIKQNNNVKLKNNGLKIYTVSSLEKVFPNEQPKEKLTKYSILRNERFSFQVVCFSDSRIDDIKIDINSDLKNDISLRRVVYAPSVLATKHNNHDDYIIKSKNFSGVYPDILFELQIDEKIPQGVWTAFWVTVNHNETTLQAGTHNIAFTLKNGEGKELAMCSFALEVLDYDLCQSDLIITNWMHYDCIQNYYGVEVFTDEYYEYLNPFLKSQVEHGINMLYTPLFTPSLDTCYGYERSTAQLVDITLDGEKYIFDFSRLKYFIENGKNIGYKYFEFSHILSQWGGKYCPKIVAKNGDKLVKIFGWENSSTSKEFTDFLTQFLTELKEFIIENGYMDIVYFHMSDEPHLEDIETIKTIKGIFDTVFANNSIKIMDALNFQQYYDENIVTTPVVALCDYEKFDYKNADEKWIYYSSWHKKQNFPNRFFNMPSQRNRILGMQLYLNDITGFLHWGYNFYNNGGSTKAINPYQITDADGVFESGDAFMVYPANKAVRESLRNEVFYEGINDYRALKTLELLYGKQFVKNLLQKQKMKSFTKYKKSAKWHLRFREIINKLIISKI